MEYVKSLFGKVLDFVLTYPDWVLYSLIGVLLLGIVLGFRKTIVVYRDFNDLGIVFSIVLIPMSAMLILLKLGFSDIPEFVYTLLLVLEILVLLVIAYSTWKDNPNPLKWVLAMYTKIPLGVLFILVFVDFLVPEERRDARKRQGQMALLLLLAPIIIGLVKDKQGLLSMRRTIVRLGRR